MNKWIKRCCLLAFFGVSSVVFLRWYSTDQREQGPIRSFMIEEDLPFVLENFERDWFWLVADDPENYDPAFYFRNRTWSKNPAHFGKMHIKMITEGDQQAGLVAYYKKTFYEGFVLYLVVHPDFRCKGYGYQLMRHAIHDLFSQGCTVIKLVTRLINKPARTVYEDLGFVETERDDPFIYYTLHKHTS